MVAPTFELILKLLLIVLLCAGFAYAETNDSVFSSKLCVKNALASNSANAYEACSITTGMDLLGSRVSTVENDLAKLETSVENDLSRVDGDVAALATRVTQLEGQVDAAPAQPAVVAMVRLADQHAPDEDGVGAHEASPFLFETRTPGSAFDEVSAAAAAFWGGGATVARISAEPAGPLKVAVQIVSDETLSAAFTAASTYGFMLTLTCTFEADAPTPAPVDPTPAPIDPTPAPVDPTPSPVVPLEVITVYGGWTFYKVPVSGTMTSPNVHAACQAHGLVTPCYAADPGHSWNGGQTSCTAVLPRTDSSCSDNVGAYLLGRLACNLCGDSMAKNCAALEGIYSYMENWSWQPGACGVEDAWCSDGRNYSNRDALCAEPENSG